MLLDDNQITIDGATSLSCSDDQLIRFLAAGWSVRRVDGHDHDAIAQAINEERETNRPSLIACRTVIGYGAPTRQGTEKVHGAPLGADELAKTREALCWPYPPFDIPQELLARWRDDDGAQRDCVVKIPVNQRELRWMPIPTSSSPA